MPKKATEALRKHTLNLYEGDMEKLRILFPDQEPSVLIREMINATIRKIEESAEPATDQIKVEISL